MIIQPHERLLFDQDLAQPDLTWPPLGARCTNDLDEICLVVGHELDQGQQWVTVKLPSGAKCFHPLSDYHERYTTHG